MEVFLITLSFELFFCTFHKMNETKNNIKIRLRSNNTIEDILGFLRSQDFEKLVFLCPHNYPLLAEVTTIKKIKACLEEESKSVVFVTMQKWVRDLLHSKGVPVEAKCPEAFLDLKTLSLNDFTGKVKAEKNKIKEVLKPIVFKKKEKPKAPPMEFSTYKIPSEEEEKSLRSFFFFGFLIVILLLGSLLLWISPRATVTIKPKISIVPVTQNILVKLADGQVPLEDQYLPMVQGVYMETEVRGSETFPATEKTYDVTDARGMITLVNETSKAKYLVPSRLSTEDGVIFRFKKSVTIPPRVGDTPGVVPVEIVADAYDEEGRPIGDRGNISPGEALFFPALRPNLRELYYGKTNLGALVGGSVLVHYFINESDFDAAKVLLEEIFRTRAVEKLRKEIQGRSKRDQKKYVLLDRAEVSVAELKDVFFPYSKVGEESQTFDASVALKLSGLVFDQSEIIKLLEAKAREVQDHRKKLIYMDENSIQYNVLNAERLADEKWVKLSVSILGVETLDFGASTEFAQQWQRKIKEDVVGETAVEAKRILSNYPEIEEVLEVEISPFWSEHIPYIFERIKLKLIEGYE